MNTILLNIVLAVFVTLVWSGNLPNDDIIEGEEEEVVVDAPNGTCLCGEENAMTEDSDHLDRIVDGVRTRPHQYPWLAGLYREAGQDDWQHFCGGSLISSQHILTAAHCVFDDHEELMRSEAIQVLLGGHSRKLQWQNLLKVSNITVHKGYELFKQFETEREFLGWQIRREKIFAYNDLAILTLSDSVSFNIRVKPACLPADASEDYSFKMATVAGWGQLLTSADISLPKTPRAVTQMVLSNKMCELMYREASIQRFLIYQYEFFSCDPMLSVPTFALLWMEEVSVLETRGVLCLLKKTTKGIYAGIINL